MLRLNLLQNEWLFVALLGGLSLALGISLAYVAIWRSRHEEEREAARPITGLRSLLRWAVTVTPLVLILTVFALALLAIAYPILKAIDPPNW